MGQVFRDIYDNNLWGHPESRSGFGSTLVATENIRAELPDLVREIGAKSLLDIPCGDFNWMNATKLGIERYIGADLVEELVTSNSDRYGASSRTFVKLDIVADALPRVDLVLCRDILIHFPDDYVFRAIENVRASGARYLLTTTFRNVPGNGDIPLGSFRPINLERPPFSFPKPMRIIKDEYEGRRQGRCLALWRLAELPVQPGDELGAP
jgi:hypothetical protein